ncbi:MAG: Mu-like prophage major head subunit gpT family protein [Dehalococcoidia bacterium]|jgi:phage major head subunit gpT-like protein
MTNYNYNPGGTFINARATDIYDPLFTNYNAVFWSMYNDTPIGQWRSLCQMRNSTSDSEVYNWYTTLAAMREFKDVRQHSTFKADTVRYGHKEWEWTVDVFEKDILDDKTGSIVDLVRMAGSEAARHKDELLGDFINYHIGTAGTGSDAYPPGFDGKTIFNTAHTAWTSGGSTQNNLRSSATTANSGKCDATNAAANIAAAKLQLAGFTNAAGKKMGLRATHFIGASNTIAAATQVLRSNLIVMGVVPDSSATTSEIIERGNLNVNADVGIQIIENPYMTSGYWMLASLIPGVRSPFVFQMRQDVYTERDDSQMFEKKLMSFGGYARYNIVPGAWFLAVAGDGT